LPEGYFTMEDLRARYCVITELVPFPGLARLIGIYTAQFARIELSLWQTYGLVLGIDEDDAMILFGDLQSFATKLTAIERYFIERRNHIPGNYLTKMIFNEVRAINTFRNKISHGLYLTDKEATKVFVLGFGSDPKRQIPMSRTVAGDETNYFELTETLLTAEIDKLHNVMAKILGLIKWLKPNSVVFPSP
jgi:hypothetical protein